MASRYPTYSYRKSKDSDGVYHVEASTEMPCGTVLHGRGHGQFPVVAERTARHVLDAGVRQHVRRCKFRPDKAKGQGGCIKF